jgi:hypothetical protein
MSGRLARLAAATVLAAGLTTFAFAVPAHAEGEVDVNMGSLDSSMDAGESDDFTVRMRNQTDQQFQPLRVVFTIRLDGLEANHVRIFGQFGLVDAGSRTGEVRLAERVGRFLNEEGRRNSSITVRYRITLTDSAPGGQARVTAQAIANNQVLGTDEDEVRIEGDAAPTTTEPQTETGGPRSEEPGPTVVTPPAAVPTAATQATGSPPVILYVLGGMLVLAGGAMLWLLFRRPRPALVDGFPAPYDTGPIGGAARLSHPVYPPPPGPLPRPATPPTEPFRSAPPTAAMPTFGPTYAPQHSAVDPWADSAEDQFPR